MIHERIYLRPENQEVYLDTYIAENPQKQTRPAILVCPGGGYTMCAAHEAEVIALQYVARGINAFVLYYSTKGNDADFKYPKPLVDASNAMKHIKDNSERYNINPDNVFVLGFSAGGHLASTLGTIWHRKEVYDAAEAMEYGYNKPRGMILCYPVISYPEFSHVGSFYNLGGPEKTEEEYKYLSSEKNVDENTCPAFLWHTSEDKCVPVENSLLMASALSRAKIPFELHIYPYGHHGVGYTAYDMSGFNDPHIASWIPLSIEWIYNLK